MPDDASPEVQQLKGGLDILFTLKEEFAQWADEAQDASKKEALENVLAHVENMEGEYRRRLQAASSG